MTTLYIMVGLSGSGKSTVAKDISENTGAIIVSSDKIRERISYYEDQSRNDEVFKIFHEEIKSNLLSGKSVIADATNLTIKSRAQILRAVENINCTKGCWIVAKRFEDCIRDNQNREHPVPDEVIDKQLMRFQIPFLEEGLDFINITDFCDNKLPEYYWYSKMTGFNQRNPHHDLTLDKHSEKVKELFCNKYIDHSVGALYHDLGKIYTMTVDDEGIGHFYQHHNVSAYLLLTEFKDVFLEDIFLANYHMMPFSWETEKSKRKWRKIFGDKKYEMLQYFNLCDKYRGNVKDF